MSPAMQPPPADRQQAAELGPWEPLSLADAVATFATARVPWWIAGGYAIELAVGRAFRQHEDIDILLLRRDQLAAQDVL